MLSRQDADESKNKRLYNFTENNMSDDKTKAGGQDRTRINTSEDYEVRDWSKKLGVSAEQLKAAVKAVGSNAKDVEAHLKGGISHR